MDRFGPYLGSVLESLVTLLGEVETNGAKRRVINVLVVVIGASKEGVSKFTNGPRFSLLLQYQITPLLAPLVAPIPTLCALNHVCPFYILTLLNRGGADL